MLTIGRGPSPHTSNRSRRQDNRQRNRRSIGRSIGGGIQSEAEVLNAVDGIVGVRFDGSISIGVIELACRGHCGKSVQNDPGEAAVLGSGMGLGQQPPAQPAATLLRWYKKAPDFACARTKCAYAHAAGGFAMAGRDEQEARCGVETAELAQLRGHVVESSAHIGGRRVSFHGTFIVPEEAPDNQKISFIADGIHVNTHRRPV